MQPRCNASEVRIIDKIDNVGPHAPGAKAALWTPGETLPRRMSEEPPSVAAAPRAYYPSVRESIVPR